MVKGQEFHSILKNIFEDVKGYLQSQQVQVNCPRCQERDGLAYPDNKFNLEINTSLRVFRCWKCEEPRFSGTLGRLIKIYGSKSDYEFYKSFADTYSEYEYNDQSYLDEIKIDVPKETILFSEMDTNNSRHFEAYNYMVNERKISREVLIKYGIGFCIDGDYANRIIIPSYNINGEVDFFVSRTYDPSVKKMIYDMPKARKELIVFNEGMINWDSTIYLVEGVFDMLSLPINTIPLLGKTISPKLLLNRLNVYKPNIIIVLDPDAIKDSINLMYKLKNLYVDCEEKIKMVKLPDNYDIDEIRVKYGNERVVECLHTARDLTVDDYFISNLYEPKRYYK